MRNIPAFWKLFLLLFSMGVLLPSVALGLSYAPYQQVSLIVMYVGIASLWLSAFSLIVKDTLENRARTHKQ